MSAVGSLPIGSKISSPVIHMVSLLPFKVIFKLYSWLKKRFRPFDRDSMTNTALKATASTSGMNFQVKVLSGVKDSFVPTD